MKKIFIVLALCFIKLNIYAQAPCQPLKYGNTLNSVFFVSENLGWAVGYCGTILVSTDGGIDWTNQVSGAKTNLTAVYFINQNIGWIVGLQGTILYTTNGGVTWNFQDSGTIQALKSIYFIDQNSGWIVGTNQLILHTTNGGLDWLLQANSNRTSIWLNSVYFIDSINGWAAGTESPDGGRAYDIIYRTNNGGIDWIADQIGTWYSLKSVYFVDKNIGWAVGEKGVTKTTDGGITWIPQLNATNHQIFYASYFINQDTGWVVGGSGATILKTTNGGSDWDLQTLDDYNVLYSVNFINENNGWAVGGDGVVLKTTNGGTDWMYTKKSVEQVIRNFVLGGYEDAGYGNSWMQIDVGRAKISNGNKDMVLDFIPWKKDLFCSFDSIFNYFQSDTLILQEGLTNINFEWGFKSRQLNNLIIPDSIFNINYQIYDVSRNSVIKNSLMSLIVGDTVTAVYDTLSGGSYNYFEVKGTRYDQFYTQSGQKIITRIKVNPSALLISSEPNNFDYSITNTGNIYFDSLDYLENNPYRDTLAEIISNRINNIEGVMSYSSLPIKFGLYQNFPNPFNPSTTINFDVSKSCLVTIKIYDVLGREVETLVNEEKSPGRYKVEFNASNLASGLYFYRMTSNNFSETRKMLLMK
jgi:photosystem II stability/assembly factor-like uncharacterized protein